MFLITIIVAILYLNKTELITSSCWLMITILECCYRFQVMLATFDYNNPDTTTQLPYEYSTQLISPTLRLTDKACLQISFIAYTPFTVKLVFAVKDVYTENVLHRNLLSMGNKWRFLNVSLTPEKINFSDFVIVLETTTTKQMSMVIVQSLQLLRNDCIRSGELGMLRKKLYHWADRTKFR